MGPVILKTGPQRRGCHPALKGFAVWLGDLDGDLDLDLLVGANGLEEGDYGDPNYVLFNDGSGRFEDRSERLTEEERIWLHPGGGHIGLRWRQRPRHLHHQPPPGICRQPLALQWGRWTQFTTHTDAGANLDMQGMGLGIGDLNEDGLPDLFLADSFGLNF